MTVSYAIEAARVHLGEKYLPRHQERDVVTDSGEAPGGTPWFVANWLGALAKTAGAGEGRRHCLGEAAPIGL